MVYLKTQQRGIRRRQLGKGRGMEQKKKIRVPFSKRNGKRGGGEEVGLSEGEGRGKNDDGNEGRAKNSQTEMNWRFEMGKSKHVKRVEKS